MAERFRILFFSDWRIQPIDWVETMLVDAGDIDLIVYGGDDLLRFYPPIEVPEEVRSELQGMTTAAFRARVKSRTATADEVEFLVHRAWPWQDRERLRTPWKAIGRIADETVWSRWEGDPQAFWDEAIRVSGRRPPTDIDSHELPTTVPEALRLLYSDFEQSSLEALARYARFGLVGVAGNDCLPGHNRVLRSSHVTDLHKRPVNIEGWGFAGIEGAITSGRARDDPADRNAIGFILHSDKEAARHLSDQVDVLGVRLERLVVVSHTPPRGMLDTALRFGVHRIGSPALRHFVKRQQPALVLTGHCHSSGRRSEWAGRTLVINGASDDTKAKQCAAAVIELVADEPPQLRWLSPIRQSVLFMPGVGPKRQARLNEDGVHTLDQLFDASPEVIRRARLSIRKVDALKEALETNSPVWIKHKQIELPQQAIFYDVETGLGIGRDREWPEPQHPWLIGAMIEGTDHVHQWVALDPSDKGGRRRMYSEFFELAEAYPEHTLSSWSGTGFDSNAIWEGLSRYWPRRVRWWEKRTEVDILRSGPRRRVVFPSPNWSLKTVASVLDFKGFENSDMDGFEVGLRYELYLALGERMPLKQILRYNETDIRALAHFVAWFRANQPERATGTRLTFFAGWEPQNDRLLALLIGDDPVAISRYRIGLKRSYSLVACLPEDATAALTRRPDIVFVCGLESSTRMLNVIKGVLASELTSTSAIVVLDGPELPDRLGGVGQIIWRKRDSKQSPPQLPADLVSGVPSNGDEATIDPKSSQ
jgi:Icc-related predicted phosphoesterase/uncharacterized protein YprB with RNaseH-like and TPR domain